MTPPPHNSRILDVVGVALDVLGVVIGGGGPVVLGVFIFILGGGVHDVVIGGGVVLSGVVIGASVGGVDVVDVVDDFFADVRRARKGGRGRTGLRVGGWRRPESGDVSDTPGVRLAWVSAGRLAEYLVARAVRRPEGFRERYAEEWYEHRTHRSGWPLLWWALCVRATAARTGRELQDARLPHLDR
jgi:hypothetical protein